MFDRLRPTPSGRAAGDREQGFTLIELLVVMIIIGILAAIAIPAFLSQKKKARDTSAKADVTAIGKEVAAYYVDNSANLTLTSTGSSWTLTDDAATAFTTTGTLSKGNGVVSVAGNFSAATRTFCVAVLTSDGNTWKYSADGGLAQGACSGTS